MKPSLLWLGLCALSLGSPAPDTQAPDSQVAAATAKILTFDCSDGQVGDTCLNMCYGAKCKKLGTTLTWDHPSKSTEGKRSRLAGCGSGNRCSKAPYGKGYQCDEFPFKSVRQADKGGQVNRCVKSHYNSRQGHVLQNFYYSHGEFKNKGCKGRAPCQFRIGFKRFSKYKYCKKKPDCKNDGNEYTKKGPAKREEEVDTGGYYRLASGDVIFVPDGAQVGDLVYQATFSNATIGVADIDGVEGQGDEDEGDENYGDDPFEVQEDQIVEEVADYE
ncbi:hypothetical protein BDV32DRAFT_116855 [Aspergillus pseudonomiae]|uniref:Deoxyribonuclease NucA/NucB domain-containing protein n=1 Tax=Aspergillus pseudonomiae TaxID=1506151 RepID=A0A5N6IGG4_9EURO|nr:uncharacterized protein BDV37DRAFT_18074 [Aspergillus pseudonomiae]KAB8264919.1 hypothetical protein BDV32DRAFT_116855 [Aspergillus pseudonomiae]KAE8407425.1 hypothetical protein BDV37DRAFT_18074 [Aspergillus pseudonomiae]